MNVSISGWESSHWIQKLQVFATGLNILYGINADARIMVNLFFSHYSNLITYDVLGVVDWLMMLAFMYESSDSSTNRKTCSQDSIVSPTISWNSSCNHMEDDWLVYRGPSVKLEKRNVAFWGVGGVALSNMKDI